MNERAAKILKIAIGTVIVAGIIAGAVVFVCKNEKARNAISDFADKCKMKKKQLHDKYLEACSNLSLSSGGLDPKAGVQGGSGLIL